MSRSTSETRDLEDQRGGGISFFTTPPQHLAATEPQDTDFEPSTAQNDNDDDRMRVAIDDVKRRTLYVNILKGGGISEMKAGELVREIYTTNKVMVKGCQRMSDCLKLLFHDVEARDLALNGELVIAGKKFVMVENMESSGYAAAARRNNGRAIRTIHLHGIPPEFPSDGVKRFLKDNGLVSVYDEKRLCYREQPEVEGPGRSYVVSYEVGTVIPPRIRWENEMFYKGFINVRVWYYGQAKFCGKCWSYEHETGNCEQFPALSYNAVSNDNFNNYEKLCAEIYANIISRDVGDDFAPDPSLLPSELREGTMIWDKYLEEKQSKTGIFSEMRSKSVTCFFSRHPHNSQLSNFNDENPFVVDGVTYISPEQFLFAIRTKVMGRPDLQANIMAAKNPHEMKQIGKSVKWGGTWINWLRWAFCFLYIANKKKV